MRPNSHPAWPDASHVLMGSMGPSYCKKNNDKQWVVHSLKVSWWFLASQTQSNMVKLLIKMFFVISKCHLSIYILVRMSFSIFRGGYLRCQLRCLLVRGVRRMWRPSGIACLRWWAKLLPAWISAERLYGLFLRHILWNIYAIIIISIWNNYGITMGYLYIYNWNISAVVQVNGCNTTRGWQWRASPQVEPQGSPCSVRMSIVVAFVSTKKYQVPSSVAILYMKT